MTRAAADEPVHLNSSDRLGWRAVIERDGSRCVQCGPEDELQFDHILPAALGGATTVENLQVLCGDCNRGKATRSSSR